MRGVGVGLGRGDGVGVLRGEDDLVFANGYEWAGLVEIDLEVE